MYNLQEKKKIDKDNENNVYVMAFVNNAYVYYGSDSTEINYNQGSPAIIKYTPYFDSVIWIKRIANAQQAAFIITTIRGGKNDDNLYLACNMRGGVDVEIEDTTYNHSEVSTYKGFLIILSANGDMIHRGFVNQNMKQGDFLSDIEATDTNKIFICGLVRDTFFRNNQQFYTSPPLPPDITPTVLETSAYLFIGRISTQSADWIKLTAKSIAATNLITGSQQRLGTDPFDNIYMSFLNRYNYSVSIGGLSDSSVQSSPFVFSKFDSLGNAL